MKKQIHSLFLFVDANSKIKIDTNTHHFYANKIICKESFEHYNLAQVAIDLEMKSYLSAKAAYSPPLAPKFSFSPRDVSQKVKESNKRSKLTHFYNAILMNNFNMR